MLKKIDLEDMKQQIESWGIPPTRVLMSRDTWLNIANPITEIYRLILKDGYKITKQAQMDNNEGIILYLEHPTVLVKMRLIRIYYKD